MSSADIKSQRELNATCSLYLSLRGDFESAFMLLYSRHRHFLQRFPVDADTIRAVGLSLGLFKFCFAKKDQMKITDQLSYFVRNLLIG